MKREEILTLGFEELESRALEIAEESKNAEDKETVEALNEELETIEERKLQLNQEIEERAKTIEEIQRGAGKILEKEERTTELMTNIEVRNTPQYIEAFANYIKTGKDEEVRALLTENVNGTIPVPEIVESRVRQAWENDEIFSRVTKTFVRGNLKVGFELSATDAVIHVEGTAAPAEENLVLGIVNLVPATIKKWITFSTEVMALGAVDFLNYIYDELTYKIIQKAADIVVEKILAAPAASTATAVGVPKVQEVGSVEGVIDAIAKLGDNARNNVFIANSQTIAAYKKMAFGYSFPIDPFQGLTVIKKDSMNDNVVIVGDLSGVQANLPEGDSVRFVFDEYSLAEKDLIKLVGRMMAAIEVVGPKMFAVISAE